MFDRIVIYLQYRRLVRYTDGRAKKLASRLKSFSEDELTMAAKALTDNAYMMGDNPGGVRYATIDYLLRSDEIVEKWLEQADDTVGEIDLSTLTF